MAALAPVLAGLLRAPAPAAAPRGLAALARRLPGVAAHFSSEAAPAEKPEVSEKVARLADEITALTLLDATLLLIAHELTHTDANIPVGGCRSQQMRLEMDKINIKGAFRCCALGTRKRLVVFSVCSYLIQFNSIQ